MYILTLRMYFDSRSVLHVHHYYSGINTGGIYTVAALELVVAVAD